MGATCAECIWLFDHAAPPEARCQVESGLDETSATCPLFQRPILAQCAAGFDLPTSRLPLECLRTDAERALHSALTTNDIVAPIEGFLRGDVMITDLSLSLKFLQAALDYALAVKSCAQWEKHLRVQQNCPVFMLTPQEYYCHCIMFCTIPGVPERETFDEFITALSPLDAVRSILHRAPRLTGHLSRADVYVSSDDRLKKKPPLVECHIDRGGVIYVRDGDVLRQDGVDVTIPYKS